LPSARRITKNAPKATLAPLDGASLMKLQHGVMMIEEIHKLGI
jgi:hypothetical protein